MGRAMIYQKVRDLLYVNRALLILVSLSTGAFYMVGDIDSARAKGEKILAELEGSS